MTRYTSPRTPEMTDEQRRLRDTIVDGPRGRAGAVLVDADERLIGPFGPMLLDPELGNHLQAIGLRVQANTDLAATTRELVILRVASARDCPFEWNAHVAKARGLGVADATLAAVRAGEVPDDADDATAAVLRYTEALLDHADLGDELYEDVTAAAGPGAVFATTVLVGYYELLANLFRGFGLARPDAVEI